MASRKPIVMVNGVQQQIPAGDTLSCDSLDTLGYMYLPLGEPEGLTLSRNASNSNTQIDIAFGRCVLQAPTGRFVVLLSNPLTIRLDTLWSAGGNRFSSSVTINQWWHVFIMRNDSTGAISGGFDTDINGTNKPAGWSVRRIGAIRTDASSNIRAFTQVRNTFYWNTESVDFNSAIPTTATLYTISTPPGYYFEAIVRLASGLPTTGNANVILLSSPLISDQAPSRLGTGPASTETAYVMATTEFESSVVERILTDTLSRIRARASFGTYQYNPRIATIGWVDSRGVY